MKLLPILSSLFLAVTSTTLALQTIPITSHADVTATLSADSYNTLMVNGDRISQFVTTQGAYQSTADATNGFLYIKPSQSHQTIDASITTEHGEQFQAHFKVNNETAQNILFLPPDSFKKRAKKWEEQTNYSTLLVQLTKAMVQGNALEGYTMQGMQNNEEKLGNVATLQLIRQYDGAHLIGHVYQLSNITATSLQLKPAQLYRTGTRALTLSSEVVPPKGTILVYEVASHA